MSKFLAALLVAFVAFQGAALASVAGKVSSVDSEVKSLQVETAEGSSSVSYGDATEWPAGVTDPSQLVGLDVSVETDEITGEAVSVK